MVRARLCLNLVYSMYIFAKLGKFEFLFTRFFGSGLGNILFPWARSVVAAKKYGLQCIEPTWLNLRVGSIIRKESDLRFYSDLFFNANENICGFKKIIILIFFKTVPEQELEKSGLHKNKIVIFTGMKGFFQPIVNDYEFINYQLIKITSPKHLLGLSFDFSNSISLHVRLGDFKAGKQTTPIEWYVNVVNLVRKISRSDLKLYIFSDGCDKELWPLLALHNSQRLAFGSSIADLLALSRSNILICSKGSTFSMWASYLGRMPVIWPVGGLTQRLYSDNYFQEIESDGYSIAENFIVESVTNPSSTTPATSHPDY
jgi:hypothetical protein